MSDTISRQAVLKKFQKICNSCGKYETYNGVMCRACEFDDAKAIVEDEPSVHPEDWMERNKERILQAGMEGQEIEFRIGGRLFAIREKAQ